jgi:hypothetical protein
MSPGLLGLNWPFLEPIHYSHENKGFTSAAVLLAGCATSTGLAPKTSYSGFDNAAVVDIPPHGNVPNGGFNMIATGIGAQWNQAHKDQVILVIAVFNLRTVITGAELNIDGKKFALAPTPGITDTQAAGDIMKESTRDFISDLATVKKITESKRTWLRVHTPTGAIENAVIDGDKDSKAFNALKRFLNQVRVNGGV